MKANVQMTKHDLLRKVPLFSDLSKKNLNEIAKVTDEMKVAPGKVLAKEGARGLEFILILEGEARVEKDGEIINRLSVNNFFGEIALIDGRPRAATVVAETDMKLLVVGSRFFTRLLEVTPGLSKEIMIALCKYLREAESKRAIR
jgi:CRP/FNR family cyclic AMP-dependent transcriptional regulator